MKVARWWERKRVWQIGQCDERSVKALSAALSLPPLVAKVLLARNFVQPEEARRFLSASFSDLQDPFALKDMDASVELLKRALREGEPILVHGDYDVDGVCATALLVKTLTEMGGKVFWFLPHRLEDGYGVSLKAVQQARKAGIKVFLAADCGTTSHKAVEAARAVGMDFIIVDHHELQETLPPASALLNPKRPDSSYPHCELCSTAIAFKLAQALVEVQNAKCKMQNAKCKMQNCLDLVALATVADVVPLVGENRAVVREGLKELNKRERVGLRVLIETAGIGKRLLKAFDIGFLLGPRLNAAGRLEHARQALQLLLSDDEEQARKLAKHLNNLNHKRQREEEKTLQQALSLIEEEIDIDAEPAIVLAQRGWHPGVVGIVAARLVELFHRPAVLIALDDEGKGKGSARSIRGFHLTAALQGCSQHLLSCGGHAQAAGLTIEERAVLAFRHAFNEIVMQKLSKEDLTPHLQVDAVLSPKELSLEAVEKLSLLEPHGFGNPKPVLALFNARLLHRSLRGEDGQHLFLRVQCGERVFELIGFRMGDAFDALEEGMPIDVCFTADADEFNGVPCLSLRLKDFRTPASNVILRP